MRDASRAAKGWRADVFRDLDSSMNNRQQGLPRLLELSQRRPTRCLVRTHKARRLRFGAEWALTRGEWQGIDIGGMHPGDPPSVEAE